MSPERLKKLLSNVRSGRLSPASALSRLRTMPFEDIGSARVDHHRAVRCGHAEVILAQGKTWAQLREISGRIAASGSNLLVTRLDPGSALKLKRLHPRGTWNRPGRIFGLTLEAPPAGAGRVLVIAAGTSDLPVAEEAAFTLEFTGNPVDRLYDVGVAGIHRLLVHTREIQEASVLVVVAGMDGALASVVGGLGDRPLIAVPTSVGYGASFGGVAALLSMLNSCASGVTVVTIDTGFGAGFAASRINHPPAAGSAPRRAPARRRPPTSRRGKKS